MEIVIQPDGARAELLTARLIRDALLTKPRLALGLATGSTMEAVYRHLAEMYRARNLDFDACSTFNLDEYVGLSADCPDSYRQYMERHLFQRVNLSAGNTHLPDGACADTLEECRRYEEAIRVAGGIDLQLLGIGANGHIGFNEPLSAFRSRTRVVPLTPDTIERNARHFAKPERMPHYAITMGVGTILEAGRCILLATGAAKAAAVAAAVEGPMTSMISASALQLHPDCVVIADQDAAAGLRGAAHYRQMFDCQQKWEAYRG